jgi:outer membrane receptor protein involved in Fe transport
VTYCGADPNNPPNCAADENGVLTYEVGGNQLGRTIEHQFNGFVELGSQLTGDWDWYARIDVSWQDEQPVRSLNAQFLDSYTLVNARAGVMTDRWEVAIWSKNLLDEDYLTAVSAQPRFHTGNITDTTLGYGQIWGLTATLNFGGK